MNVARLAWTGALFAALVCASANAQDGAATRRPFILTLQTENDFFARWTDSDRHYTNGLRASAFWQSGQSEDWLNRLVGAVDPLIRSINPTKKDRWIGLAVGQSIFTPEDTDRDNLIRSDRPYAGWLYVSAAINYRYLAEHPSTMGVQDTFALELGVVGPYARAQEVQNGFHDVIDVSHSRGWDNQLRNEPGTNIVFERKYRVGSVPVAAGLELDFIPNLAVSLGNVATYGAAGGIVRFGDLDSSGTGGSDFGPPRIRPSLPGSELFDVKEFRWYVFAGLEGEIVGHNIFLDGNAFRTSHGVEKNRFVGEFQAGLAVLFAGARVSYSHVFRSPEFEGQPRWNQFGALSLSYRF